MFWVKSLTDLFHSPQCCFKAKISKISLKTKKKQKKLENSFLKATKKQRFDCFDKTKIIFGDKMNELTMRILLGFFVAGISSI